MSYAVAYCLFYPVWKCSADWAFVQKNPAAKLDSELAEPSTLFSLIAPKHLKGAGVMGFTPNEEKQREVRRRSRMSLSPHSAQINQRHSENKQTSGRRPAVSCQELLLPSSLIILKSNFCPARVHSGTGFK